MLANCMILVTSNTDTREGQTVKDKIMEAACEICRWPFECNGEEALMKMCSVCQVEAAINEPDGKWEYRYVLGYDGKPDFCSRRWYCPACGDWQAYGQPEYCPSCGARVERGDGNG